MAWLRAGAWMVGAALLAITTRVAAFIHQQNSSTGEEGKEMEERATTLTALGGAVRCQCNLPQCVTHNYMCKSMVGACFTRTTPSPTHSYSHATTLHHRWPPMHGCIEHLSLNLQEECIRLVAQSWAPPSIPTSTPTPTPNPPPASSSPRPHQELSCCNQDMCNYRDIDVYIQVDSRTFHSHTELRKQPNSEEGAVWFRAATIAVPIAGGFILVVLVVLAGRMLAKENKRQRIAQVLGEQYLKAPLYPVVATAPPSLHHHHHHHPLCCHPYPTKAPPMPYLASRTGYEDVPHYTTNDHHHTDPEELRPLSTCMARGQQGDLRQPDLMLPT